MAFEFPDSEVVVIAEENGVERTEKWRMYFDGAVNVYGRGIGAVVISPEDKQYPIAIKLEFECTNNMA